MTRPTQRVLQAAIAGMFLAAALASFLAPFAYDEQFRDFPDAPPSARFLLGTDEMGRDRFSRLLYGSQVSLLLAPAAALLSTLIATVIGGAAGFFGGWLERIALALADLFSSMPWLFLLLMVRAALPLNVDPHASLAITFLLLSLLGWPAGARVVRAEIKAVRESDYCLAARSRGTGAWRLLAMHVLPNLRPAMIAQFWLSVPLFLIAEANLGILGLGVSEPLPSWGNLLMELVRQHQSAWSRPWLLVPALVAVGTLLVVQLGSGVPAQARAGAGRERTE